MSADESIFEKLIDYRRLKLIAALDALNAGDPEAAHERADELLLDYIGDEKIKEAFQRVALWHA